MGLPDVQLHRNLPHIRKLQLAVKHVFLYLPGGEIVVVIQADLPQQAALGAVQIFKDGFLGGIIVAACVVGMRADGRAEEAVLLHQREHLLLIRLLLAGVGHHVGPADAALPEAGDDLRAILVEGGVGDVAVGVKDFHASLSIVRSSGCG